ncbi:MAG: type II secretion system minor pseudopilin GspI [Steroidobacteraceae bacterium]
MRGFTLIEVLVALAIVVVGMAAVLGTLNSSANTIVYLRDKTFANWVALNQIAQLRLSGAQPAVGDSDGKVDFAGRNWTWHQTVSTTQVPGMERIDVNVRPSDVKVEKEDSGWYSTAIGIWGDAVGVPRGDLPDWGAQLLAPGSAGGNQATTPNGGMTSGAYGPVNGQAPANPTTPAPATPTTPVHP